MRKQIDIARLFSYFGVDIHAEIGRAHSVAECNRILDECKAKVKRAYRDMALKYHPDLGGDTEDKMKEINELYSLVEQVRYQPPRPKPVYKVVYFGGPFDGFGTSSATTNSVGGGWAYNSGFRGGTGSY